MSEALTLFDDPASLANEVRSPRKGRVRRGQPDTAHAAAELVKLSSASIKGQILRLLAESVSGFTSEQLWIELDGQVAYPHVAHTRCRDLADLGLVVLTDRKRTLSTGREGRVWAITSAGARVVARLTTPGAA